MVGIKSYEFLGGLYDFLDNQKNQGVYIVKMFNAAGNRYFFLSENVHHQTNRYLEKERRYALNQAITPDIKQKFPNPIDLEGLAKYIEANLNMDTFEACMARFGIPIGVIADREKFARALAIQFSRFITEDQEDVDIDVWGTYQSLLNGEQVKASDIKGPLYQGDDVLVEFEGRTHDADCYELIHHEWKMQNCGKVAWQNRQLVLMNQGEIHPRPILTVISIPDTAPGGFAKIATDIDARGFEGNYDCKWEMQDANGNNCFPNKRWDFNVRIQVAFQDTEEGDERG
ncbi:NBR1-Ig-like domain-containing protein [Pseudoramibacter sp. HA2172]|uniref:NBR1-Ig-like domain-containing protein n=1 Tax=Pseudoramibacter faecis TaxID=3108534 RepID=UPI002E7848DA|nr:NBR1-Ig-like domain-containing protein [Pseudoramibacter sp. HA2172]